MDLSKIRKALMAAGTVFLGIVFTGLQAEVPHTASGWGGLLGGAVAAAVVAGWATWRVPNAR